MEVDPVPAFGRDPPDHAGQTRVVEIGRATASGTHDMMVMIIGFAGDVGVIARGKVDPLNRSNGFEDLESPEDRRPGNPRLASRGVFGKISRSEVALARRDEVGDGPAWTGQSITGADQCGLGRLGQVGDRVHADRIRGRVLRP